PSAACLLYELAWPSAGFLLVSLALALSLTGSGGRSFRQAGPPLARCPPSALTSLVRRAAAARPWRRSGRLVQAAVAGGCSRRAVCRRPPGPSSASLAEENGRGTVRGASPAGLAAGLSGRLRRRRRTTIDPRRGKPRQRHRAPAAREMSRIQNTPAMASRPRPARGPGAASAGGGGRTASWPEETGRPRKESLSGQRVEAERHATPTCSEQHSRRWTDERGQELEARAAAPKLTRRSRSALTSEDWAASSYEEAPERDLLRTLQSAGSATRPPPAAPARGAYDFCRRLPGQLQPATAPRRANDCREACLTTRPRAAVRKSGDTCSTKGSRRAKRELPMGSSGNIATAHLNDPDVDDERASLEAAAASTAVAGDGRAAYRGKASDISRTSALLSGFAIVAMVELEISSGSSSFDLVVAPAAAVPSWLLVLFASSRRAAALLIAVHMLALMISTCLLPNLESVSENDARTIRASPHDKMRFYIETSWIFSTGLGILLFLVVVVLQTWPSATAIAPVVVGFVVFALVFYHQLTLHKFRRAALMVERLLDLRAFSAAGDDVKMV
uniref:Protein kinase domain-containing protein n=1 Tax=Macrostomum lignano TaxID=282301 RepID=A0A1I8FRF4_9PLAT